MITIILALLFALLMLTSVSLLKTYQHIPVKELKRRALRNDELAKALYSAVEYGISLPILLWIIIGITTALFFLVITSALPSWVAVFGCAAILWVGFAWLPNARVTKSSQLLAKKAAPAISWVLSFIYPLFNAVGGWVKRHSKFTVHSGLYQKEDLIELLDKQSGQPDNRMTAYEIGIVKSALSFSEKIIRDIMTPSRVVKTVSMDDSIGPILLDELHASGFSRFPVTGEAPNDIVGTLYLHDLVEAKHGGRVATHMKKAVYYVNEEKQLDHALQAFIKTKHHLFIVVNGFEEIVGILTIEDVLEEVLGKEIVDEFDQYEDLRAVAALQAKKDTKQRTHAPTSSETLSKEEDSKPKS